jgi:F-type H+-transporting ATPase subunit b
MEDVLKALNFEFGTFILQSINLLIVIGFLYYFLYKPVGKVIADREAKVANTLLEADKSREEATKLLTKYEEQIKEAKSHAQEIIATANKVGDEMKDKLVLEARQEADKQLVRAKTEIEVEKSKALSEIKGELADIIVTAAGKVIGKEISSKEHEQMLQSFVREAGKVQ